MIHTDTATKALAPAYGTPRDMPWNVMGGSLNATDASVADVLKANGLDYQVRLVPVAGYEVAEGEPIAFADFTYGTGLKGVVRPMPDGSSKMLSVVGSRFRPIQNDAAFAVADNLREMGAKITGAADFRAGNASLLVVDLAKPVRLVRPDGGIDVTDLNLLIKNAHDGSAALTFALTGMRLACTNAVQAAIAKSQRAWKISHTPNAEARMDLAVKALLLATDYQAGFQVVAQHMMDTPMVDAEFAKIVARLFPVAVDAEGAAAERRRGIQESITALYHSSTTLEGVRGTRWGGYNALTEYMDHYRPVKGSDAKAQSISRAEGALEGPYVRTKESIWKMMATV